MSDDKIGPGGYRHEYQPDGYYVRPGGGRPYRPTIKDRLKAAQNQPYEEDWERAERIAKKNKLNR